METNGSILAIDTTLAACSAAVSLRRPGCEERVFACCEPMQTGHAERLMPMIRSVMRDAGIGFDKLDNIAVTVGPGTFTGTRVGVAAARGLAMATGRPVLATTSLAVIAAMARDSIAKLPDDGLLMVCVDARRDQVYCQDFSLRSTTALSPAVIMDTEDAAAGTAGCNDVIVVGSAAQSVSAAAARMGNTVAAGPAIAWPAAEYLFKTDLESHDQLSPLYLRPPDAKPQTNKMIARMG